MFWNSICVCVWKNLKNLGLWRWHIVLTDICWVLEWRIDVYEFVTNWILMIWVCEELKIDDLGLWRNEDWWPGFVKIWLKIDELGLWRIKIDDLVFEDLKIDELGLWRTKDWWLMNLVDEWLWRTKEMRPCLLACIVLY